MKVLVAGANGLTGKRIVAMLKDNGHDPRAMIRDGAQASAMEALGAETVVADLEQAVDHAVTGCEAVIFAAGSGSKTGPDKTDLVDRLGAIRLIEATAAAGVARFIMLSSMGTDEPEAQRPKLVHYMKAKAAADHRLRASDLSYTIVRPGYLTNDAGTGRIVAAPSLGELKTICREDVAQTIVAALDIAKTERKTFDILAGETPIRDALEAL